MVRSLTNLVGQWCDAVGLAGNARPAAEQLEQRFDRLGETCRAGADPARIRSWERRFGFPLPEGLKAWLRLSDGFYAGDGPLIHPLSAVGPMIPFAPIPGLKMQPESWFELGNPNRETVCIDLGYRWPGGDYPMFTSGDDKTGTLPRLMATGFVPWFLRVLQSGGSEFWLAPGFRSLGDPWVEHRRMVPSPPIADVLRPHAGRVSDLLGRGVDDGSIARELNLTRGEVEALVRHIQHVPAAMAPMGAQSGR